MRILLVYPRYPDTFWSFKHALKYISKKAAFAPLGLLTIASMLPENWEIRLTDLNVADLEDDQIRWADMVFISAMLVQRESAQEIIHRCKSLDTIIVAGGPAFSVQHQKFPEVDHFVLNEAEMTLPMFLDDLKAGMLKRVYMSSERPDITKTPVPKWSLIDFKHYATPSIQYSRGCPFNCEFCDIIVMNGRIPRTKSPGQMLAELDELYNAGWRGSVFIVDDNFIGNKIKVKKLLPELIRWQTQHKYPFMFLTEASTNLADDVELMQMMSAANFFKVFVGLETPNIESLKECGKYQNTSGNLAESVKKIQQHGMQVMGGFIVGFDNDTPTVFETQIRFIQQVGVVTAMVGLLNAIPKTRLWHRLKGEGRLLGDSSGENTDGSLNFIPNMGKEKLIEGYHNILGTIYSRKFYYERINTFIKNYKPTVRTRLRRTEFKALIRSMWRIGIFSKSNFLYWKLLFRTGFTKYKALPIAVEMAIIGHHFQEITKRILVL